MDLEVSNIFLIFLKMNPKFWFWAWQIWIKFSVEKSNSPKIFSIFTIKLTKTFNKLTCFKNIIWIWAKNAQDIKYYSQYYYIFISITIFYIHPLLVKLIRKSETYSFFVSLRMLYSLIFNASIQGRRHFYRRAENFCSVLYFIYEFWIKIFHF